MPYGELITQLTGDLSQLEAKLKKAEQLLRDFHNTAKKLSHVQLSASVGTSGRTGAAGTGRSPVDDDLRSLQERSRARVAESKTVGDAQRAVDQQEWQRELARERVSKRRQDAELAHAENIRKAKERLHREEDRKAAERKGTMGEMRRDIIARQREEDTRQRREDTQERANQRVRDAHKRNVERDATERIRMGQRGLRLQEAEGRRNMADLRTTQAGARRADRVTERGQRLADKATAAADAMRDRLIDVAAFGGGPGGVGREFGQDIIAKRMKERQQAITHLGDIVQRYGTDRFRQMRDAAGDFLDKLKMIGSAAVIGGLVAWVKKGIELNAEYQRFQMTLKTVLELSSQVTDKRTGRPVTGMRRSMAVDQKAMSLFQTIGEVAAPTNLTRRELFQVVSENLGFAMQGGAKLGTKAQDTKVVQLFAQVAQLAKNLGLPGGERQLSQEIRALFEGDRLQGASVAKLLGISNASEIKGHKKSGTLVDFLSERIKPALEQTTSNKDKFNQVLSTIKTAFEDFTRVAFSQAFDNITRALARMRDEISKPEFQQNAKKIGEVINSIAQAIIQFMQSPWPGRFLDFFKGIIDHWRVILGLWGGVKAIKFGFDATAMGFAGVRGGAKFANEVSKAAGKGSIFGSAVTEAGAEVGVGTMIGKVLNKSALAKIGPVVGKIGIITALIGEFLALIQAIHAQVDTIVSDKLLQDTELANQRMRARDPVQSKLDQANMRIESLRHARKAMIEQGLDAGMSKHDIRQAGKDRGFSRDLILAEVQRVSAASQIPGTPEFTRRMSVDAEFSGKKRPDEAQAKELAMLRAFLQKQHALITGDQTQLLRAEEMAQEIHLRKTFKNAENFHKALKALRDRFRHDERVANLDRTSNDFGINQQTFERFNHKSDAVIAGARSEIFRTRSQVMQGQMTSGQGRAMENVIRFQANKRLVDDRRQVTIQSRNLLDEYEDAVRNSSKRQRDFQNELFNFERDTILKRRQLIKDQESAQRQLNDSIRDEKRAQEDVDASKSRRGIRNDVRAFFGQGMGGGLTGRLFGKARGRVRHETGDSLSVVDENALAMQQVTGVMRTVSQQISEGDISGAVDTLRSHRVKLTPDERRRLAGLAAKGGGIAEAGKEREEAREGEDEQTRLRDVGVSRQEAGERLGDAKRALADFPKEIAKTIVELKENFNDSVRQAARQFRNLAETARQTVEEIGAMGGAKSPMAAQIGHIQKLAATKGGQRPHFMDAKKLAHETAGDVRASMASGGIIMNVNFQMSADTKRMMEEIGKLLERDMRRVAPRR